MSLFQILPDQLLSIHSLDLFPTTQIQLGQGFLEDVSLRTGLEIPCDGGLFLTEAEGGCRPQ